MSQKLLGKVAIVTGASKGIGTAIALELAQEGASVVINYASDKEGAEAVVAKIKSSGGKAIAVHANMTNQAEIKHLFSETLKAFGKLDILINNAGKYEFAPLEEITPEHFYKLFDLNVLGLILATQEAAKVFGTKGGSIVNISSLASKASIVGLSVYCGTKAAVDEITRSLAQELGPRKIRVNTVNPGLIATEGTQSAGILDSDFRKETEKTTYLGRIGQPKDVAQAVLFFASDDSSWVTGESLYITGGHQ